MFGGDDCRRIRHSARTADHIRLAQERRSRTLLRHLPTPLRFHVPLHFEARQQLDIARGAVDVGFLVALLFCAGSKLCPFRLNGVARLRLVVRAPFLRLGRAAFGLAHPRDIEFRRGVRYKGGVQGSQNNDRQVNQHCCSPGA